MNRVVNASFKDQFKALEAGKFLTVQSIKGGGGSLQARKLSTGEVKFYWRYSQGVAKLRDEIGLWDSSAPPLSKSPTGKGYSVKAALEVCFARAKIHLDGKAEGGWQGHQSRLASERAAAKAQHVDMSVKTLEKLLNIYCDHLEQRGRPAHADARSIFKIHVKQASPELASAPAANLTTIQVTDLLRAVSASGKGRTANKLRSYLNAAFACAVDAEFDPDLPASFKHFHIASNPVARSKRIAGADKADKNPLSTKHLQQYWRLLAVEYGVKGAALRLHILTGGQRIEQFVKVYVQDVQADRFVLLDPKGRRADPLRHMVMLIPAALKEVKTLQALQTQAPETKPTQVAKSQPPRGRYLISTDGGATHVNAMTLTRWAQDVAKTIPGFQLKRVRSGVETLLGAADISMDLRGLLQSHGLSGVQRKHYDGNDYAPKLKAALLVLWRTLNRVSATARATKAHVGKTT